VVLAVLPTAGSEVVFSDNYFDLPAGRTATVALPALEGWTAERVREALRVRSLVDSFWRYMMKPYLKNA
jgi:beta-mannosidase